MSEKPVVGRIEFGPVGTRATVDPVSIELALRELVLLKDLKEAIEAGHECADAMKADYEARKPAAWANARRVLKTPHSGSGG